MLLFNSHCQLQEDKVRSPEIIDSQRRKFSSNQFFLFYKLRICDGTQFIYIKLILPDVGHCSDEHGESPNASF